MIFHRQTKIEENNSHEETEKFGTIALDIFRLIDNKPNIKINELANILK